MEDKFETKEKFLSNWFLKQHYTQTELEKLWGWIEKSGKNVKVECLHGDGKWSGYHIEDTDFEIDLAGQTTKEDCCNWMKRMGFNVVN